MDCTRLWFHTHCLIALLHVLAKARCIKVNLNELDYSPDKTENKPETNITILVNKTAVLRIRIDLPVI